MQIHTCVGFRKSPFLCSACSSVSPPGCNETCQSQNSTGGGFCPISPSRTGSLSVNSHLSVRSQRTVGEKDSVHTQASAGREAVSRVPEQRRDLQIQAPAGDGFLSPPPPRPRRLPVLVLWHSPPPPILVGPTPVIVI